MTSPKRILSTVGLLVILLAVGCGDKQPVIGDAKPVPTGQIRKALDATPLEIEYSTKDVATPRSARVIDFVSGDIRGSDGANRPFAVWVVKPGKNGAEDDADWKPAIKGASRGSVGCGNVKWSIGRLRGDDPYSPGEGKAWGEIYTTIKNAVCELVYGKGVRLPG